MSHFESADSEPSAGDGGYNNFPDTIPALLDQAKDSDSRIRGPALDTVLRRYLPPLKTHLIYRKRLRVEEAEDVLQSFVTDKILQAKLLKKVDPSRGRFRSWLLTVLDNYLADWERKKGRVRQIHAQPGGDELEDMANASEPLADQFEVEWARETLAEVLRRMEQALQDHRHWEVFRHRVVLPCLENAEALPYEDLVKKLGFTSPMQASNALITAKRTFVRLLQEVISEYVDPQDVEEEIRSLWAILSRSQAEQGPRPH